MNNDEIYTINYERVLESSDFSALTKSVIREIMLKTYVPFSSWLMKLSDEDLYDLITKFESLDKREKTAADILILSESLSAADGSTSTCEEDSVNNISYFVTAVTCESLKRKGLITIDYSLISFEYVNDPSITYAELIK